MIKKSHRIEFNEEERKTLEELKTLFNQKTLNGVIRQLISIAKDKYLK